MGDAAGISSEEAWLGPVAQLLRRAPAETRLLGIATPLNAAEERARLVTAAEAGEVVLPRWRYAATNGDALRRALDDAARALDRVGSKLADAYAARARELAM